MISFWSVPHTEKSEIFCLQRMSGRGLNVTPPRILFENRNWRKIVNLVLKYGLLITLGWNIQEWFVPCFEWMFTSLGEIEFASHWASHGHRIFSCRIEIKMINKVSNELKSIDQTEYLHRNRSYFHSSLFGNCTQEQTVLKSSLITAKPRRNRIILWCLGTKSKQT